MLTVSHVLGKQVSGEGGVTSDRPHSGNHRRMLEGLLTTFIHVQCFDAEALSCLVSADFSLAVLH